LGVEEVVTAPHSPWQNAYCERLIGTLRRELLDHVIVLNQQHLLKLLDEFFAYIIPAAVINPWMATRRIDVWSNRRTKARFSPCRWSADFTTAIAELPDQLFALPSF